VDTQRHEIEFSATFPDLESGRAAAAALRRACSWQSLVMIPPIDHVNPPTRTRVSGRTAEAWPEDVARSRLQLITSILDRPNVQHDADLRELRGPRSK
jgi:hypothetical protein